MSDNKKSPETFMFEFTVTEKYSHKQILLELKKKTKNEEGMKS